MLAISWATTARAQPNAGSYGASFLKIPVGARLMSSPGAVAGMRPDASLLYSNPAFIASLESTELFVTSSQWLDALSFTSLGSAIPLGSRNTVLGVGTTLLYSGGLDGYDPATNVVGEESYYDFGLDLALAHRLGTSGLSLAGGVTYVREHVLPSDGSGYALQMGASYRRGANLFHGAVRDLAGSVSFASERWDIAPEWTAGAARAFNSSAGQFFAGLEASSSDAYGKRIRVGVDYAISSAFTIRGGFNNDLDAVQSATSVHAGFGMHYGSFALEYAYTPQDYFSSTHTFSLSYRFGAPGSMSPGAIVPAGDQEPPLPDATRFTPAATNPTAGANEATTFVLVGGSYSSLESASSEARTLELLNIPTEIEREGPRYRVVLGRFTSFDDAERVRTRYRTKGHDFLIVAR
jgi:hypothetical protein